MLQASAENSLAIRAVVEHADHNSYLSSCSATDGAAFQLLP